MGNLVFGSGAERGRTNITRGVLTESPMERDYDATESERERYIDANVNPDLVEEHDNKPTPTENIDEVSISDDLENSEISLEQQNCSTLSHCWDMARSSFKITYCIIMIKSNNSLFVSCVYPSVGDLLSCT